MQVELRIINMDGSAKELSLKVEEGELLRSPRTLVIDHDPASLNLAMKNLTSLHFSNDIRTAASLREANDLILEERRKEGFDLVICPLRFPGQEGVVGFSFVQGVQGREFGRPPFVVIRTSNVEEAEQALAQADQFTRNAMMVVPRDRIDRQTAENIKRRELAHQMKFIQTTPRRSLQPSEPRR